MSGIPEHVLDDEHELPIPAYRATIRGGRLTITDWAPSLMSQERLKEMSRGSASVEATIVDLAVVGEAGDELVAVHHAEGNGLEEVDQAVVEWAGHVGYRRVWLPSQVVDIEPSPGQIGTARLTCPTCAMEYRSDGAEFWLKVRELGMFPPICMACGCEVPQWEVIPDECSSEPEHVVDSIRRFKTQQDCEQLVTEILDPERTLPIVALTALARTSSIAIPADEVALRTEGRASVCCLASGSATRALQDLVEGLRDPSLQILVPFNGAAVVWWPLAEGDSRTLSSRLVLEKSGRYGPEHVDEIVRILEAGPGRSGGRTAGPDFREQLAEERQKRKASDCEARDQRLKARDLGDKLADARKEIKRLKKTQAQNPEGDADGAPSSFQSEVAAFWAEDCMQQGRTLSPFSIGPEFEESVRACGLATRGQIVKSIAYLLGGLAGSLSVHPLRTGPGGNDPQRRRKPDGARAFRCSIKDKSNGAPRLHYWRRSDGWVELSLVAPHECFDIV